MNDGPRRVAVTGLGLVTAIGSDETSVWENLLAGRGGIGEIRGSDIGTAEVRIGAEVDFAALDRLQRGKLAKADRTLRLAVEAARQALVDAGRIGAVPHAPQEIGSIWGCGSGPAGTLDEAYRRFAAKGARGMRPSTVPNCMANSISAGVSIEFQLLGTNQVIVSACTSSTNAIGHGFRAIRNGDADAVLVGGVDALFDPFYYGVWNNLGVLSTIADPERALRPFDVERAGTLLGEGAGALLLESFAVAERRGARLRGEIVGYGESSDGTHITNPDVGGQVRAIRRALASAGVTPAEIGYINAHGTGTAANDVTESRSIVAALGEVGATIPVGAMKSYFGHTLGASGAIESIATLLALEAGVAPPNRNLERPDPECALTLIRSAPVPLASRLAIKNSFGFGGGNGVLVLRGFAPN